MNSEQGGRKCIESIRSLHRWLIHFVTILLIVLPTIAAADVVQGRFTHRIPIKIPPGTHGMQPNLALTYDSGRGNGDVGMGWALEGLSYITRCNYGNGINYNGSDTYCHSELGVLVKLADGTYRSKKESFTKFIQYGDCGSGICAWIVKDRSGLQQLYGSTSDSQLVKQSTANTIRTWGLSRVTDLYGNSYTVDYFNAAPHGRLYPVHVSYTLGNGLTTFRLVELGYEPRTDTETNYIQSDYTTTVERLKWIIVKAGCTTTSCSEGTLIRKYRLDYQCGDNSGSCPGTATGRSRLFKVTEIGSYGTSELPPQIFGWEPSTDSSSIPGQLPQTATFSGATIYDAGGVLPRPSGYDDGTRLADLNGDGLPDLIKGVSAENNSYRTAWINTGMSWQQNDAYAPPADFSVVPNLWILDQQGAVEGDLGLRLVDLNGDGLPDLIQGYTEEICSSKYPFHNAWLNNGGKLPDGSDCTTAGCAWIQAVQYAPPVSFAGYTHCDNSGDSHVEPIYWDAGLRIADLNSDGLPDLIWGSGEGQLIDSGAVINNGNGWTSAPSFAPPKLFVYKGLFSDLAGSADRS